MPVLASHWILRIVLTNQRPPLPLVARNIQPVSLSKITLQRPFQYKTKNIIFEKFSHQKGHCKVVFENETGWIFLATSGNGSLLLASTILNIQ